MILALLRGNGLMIISSVFRTKGSPLIKTMPRYIQNNPAGRQLQPAVKRDGIAPAYVAGAPKLGFVLDRSESMKSLVDQAIAGFNGLVDEQRALQDAAGQGAGFSLTLFNDTIRLLYDALPIAEVPPLSRKLYEPAGGTALNDAIGSMIQTIGKRATRSTRVLIAILTDGAENSSRSFSVADILQMITYRRTTYDWQFIFIGPREALDYALSIGIPKSNVVSFSADGAGITAIMARLSKSMKAYQLGDRRYALKLRN